MLLRHMNNIVRGIASLLFAFSVSATSTESLVGGTAATAAPEWRHLPVAASNGDGFFVAWSDYRSSTGAIIGTRVSRDGEVLDPLGIRLDSPRRIANAPHVVWDGAAYLVLWTATGMPSFWGPNDVYAARIATDGHVVMAPRVVLANAQALGGSYAASNGNVTAVICREDGAGTAKVLLLDRDANEVAHDAFEARPREPGGFSVVATAIGFVVTWQSDDDGAFVDDTVRAIALDATGRVTGAPVTVGSGSRPAIATSGSRVTIVWNEHIGDDDEHELRSRTYDSDLTNAGASHTLLAGNIAHEAAVLRNGDGSLVFAKTRRLPEPDQLARIALDSEGNAVDEDFLPVPVYWATQFAVATNASEVLLASIDTAASLSPAVVARVVRGSAVEDAVLLSWSGNAQRDPSVAAGSSGHIAAWTEDDGVYATRLDAHGNSLDGRGMRIAATSDRARVAFNGTNYVVAWRGEEFIGVRFLSPSTGTTVAETKIDYTSNDVGLDFALAASPAATYVVHTEERVLVTRIPHATHTADPVPLAVSPAAMYVGHPTAAWNGSALLVVWTEEYIPPRTDPAVWVISVNIYAARVTSGLTLLDPAPLLVATAGPPDFLSFSPPSVASNGSDWIVVADFWQSDVLARRVRSNGTVEGNGPVRIAEGNQPVIAWDGDRYVVAWKEGPDSDRLRPLFAAALPPAGPLVATGRTLMATDVAENAPVITPAAIAYTKFSFRPEHTGVERTFLRPLELTGQRRRVVRR